MYLLKEGKERFISKPTVLTFLNTGKKVEGRVLGILANISEKKKFLLCSLMLMKLNTHLSSYNKKYIYNEFVSTLKLILSVKINFLILHYVLFPFDK